MADIFDEIASAPQSKGDVFDEIAPDSQPSLFQRILGMGKNALGIGGNTGSQVGGSVGEMVGGPLGGLAGRYLGKTAQDNPGKLLEMAPAAAATVGSVLAPEATLPAMGIAALAGGAGKGAEIAGKSLLGDTSSTTPTIPFTSKPIPSIPGIPKPASDIATEAGVQGVFELPGFLTELAQKFQGTANLKALGFTKRLLNKTPKALDIARDASNTMAEEGAISPTLRAEDIADKISEIKNNAGQAIGDYLKNRGVGFDPDQAIKALDDLRPKNANGVLLTGGEYDGDHSAIDNAIETIRAHGPGPLNFEDMNTLKGKLQGLSNYNTTKNADILNKDIAGTFQRNLDQQLENVYPLPGADAEHQTFLRNKDIYGASKLAEKAITNRVSSEVGNNRIGLTDFITGMGTLGGGIASGHSVEGALGAAGAVALKKVADMYGPQTTAYFLNQIAKGDKTTLPLLLRMANQSAQPDTPQGQPDIEQGLINAGHGLLNATATPAYGQTMNKPLQMAMAPSAPPQDNLLNFKTRKAAEDFSKIAPAGTRIRLNGVLAQVVKPPRSRPKGAPKAIVFLEQPPDNYDLASGY